MIHQTSRHLDDDADVSAFVAALRDATQAVSPDLSFVFGLDGVGWRLLLARTPRGPAVVLLRGVQALVRVYDEDGSCAGSERYALAA